MELRTTKKHDRFPAREYREEGNTPRLGEKGEGDVGGVEELY